MQENVKVTLEPEAQAKLDRVLATLRRPYFFVHINKCGGTAVGHALDMVKIHKDARTWSARIGRDNWNAIRTFALVRNPYDRVCSMYRYALETDEMAPELRDLDLNQWIELTFGTQAPDQQSLPDMARPCWDWVVDDHGEIAVDLIVRLEDLKQDWHKIQAITRSPAPLPPRLNTTSVSESNGTSALSAGSRAIVADVFAKDFEAFGYQKNVWCISDDASPSRVPLVSRTSVQSRLRS